jgi:DNA-binding NarL/FixJ family response regulator
MIRVFVVDDHVIFREGLKKVLGAVPDMTVVGESGDGRDAIERIDPEGCDLVVLDLGLPSLSGLDVLQVLKAKHPSLPVIIMSIHTEDEYAVMVVKAGGCGYLTKDSVPEELVKAIRKAVRGETYVTEAVGKLLVDELRDPSRSRLHERLSNMEYRVFSSIVKGKSIKEIGHQLNLARPTVSTYRTRVLQKMNMKSNVELARYAARHHLDE